MNKRNLYGTVVLSALMGIAVMASPMLAALSPDVSEVPKDHSTEWTGDQQRPQSNVYEKTRVNSQNESTLQLGGKLVSEVMTGRTIRPAKLPNGNIFKAAPVNPGDPQTVAMSKFGYAAVLFEGTISNNSYSTKNYIAKLSTTEAPQLNNMERVVGYCNSPYNGAFNIGNVYMINYISGNSDFTSVYNVMWQEYNADNWMSWGYLYPGTGNAYVMYDTAWDPTTTDVSYGWMGKLPANDSNIGWYKLDMNTPSFTLIAQPQIAVRGVAASPAGQYFAIDADGKLYKVEKTTGAFTEIGNTGAKSEYRTTAAYDELSNMIYYVTVNDEGSSLYKINPGTGVGSKVYDFPQLTQLSNLYFGPRQALDGAPGVPKNLVTNFQQGSMSGAVEFDAPAMTYDDEPATDRLAYTISLTWTVNSQTGETETKEYTGSAAYGQHVTEYITLPAAARFTIKARCSNEVGDGPWSQSIQKYLGPDQPNTPYSFKGVYEDGKWKLTWDAHSTTGVNGGDVDPNTVEYILTFMPEGREVITAPGATSYEEEMSEPDEFGQYYWVCQAKLGDVKASGTRSTAKVGLGKIYPYWKEDFSSYTTSTKADALAGFRQLELAEMHSDWSWVTPQWLNHPHYRKYNDDNYLILPKLYLYGGRYYTFNFNVGKYGSAYGNPEFRVVMGSAPTEEGLNEKVLMDRTTATVVAGYPTRGETGNAYSVTFMPEKDGIYYIAFHHCNEDKGLSGNAGLYNMRVGNFEITAPIIPGAPEQVRNLVAEADVNGGQSAMLSFTCPRQNMEGTALIGMTRAEIKRGELMVADVPLTGSTFKWQDNEPQMGTNTYTVTPYNDNGAGNPSTVSCFVGLAAPGDVAEITAVEAENKGTVNLTWSAVTKDINGKNLSDVRYALIRNIGGENEIISTDINGLEYTDKVTDGAQIQAVYGVRAITAEGISPNWTASKTLLIGDAYQTPYIESLDGGYLRTLLVAETSDSYGSWNLFYDTDLAGVESADHDNGFLGFYSQYTGSQGALTTGRITLPSEMKNPVFSFYYYLMPSGRNTIQVMIRTDDNPQYETLAYYVAGPDGPGWQVAAVDMTPYLGKTVRMTLVVTTNSHTYTLFDRLAIYSMPDVDINNVTISAPAKAELGEEVNVTVGFMNAALKPAMNYKVLLSRDGQKVAELEGDSIAICERASVTFTDVIPQTVGDQVVYEAKVEISDDAYAADNSTRVPAYVEVIKPELPLAGTLSGVRNSETEIELSWELPDFSTRPLETVTEGFEGLTTGASAVEGWINLDRDGRSVGFGGSSNIDFPELVNNQSPAPWLAVNTTENNCDPAHGGDVFMGACYLTDKSMNDDWLISPELSGMEQTISVWARSYTNFYGGDRIEILYSNGSTDPKDFISVYEYPYLPTSWTECKVDLPEGAKHFAIRCTSIYQIMLCVDDVTYSPKGASYVAMNLLGYNVYRDGCKLNDEVVTQPTYKDDEVDGEAHDYQVTAVFDKGESAVSNKVTVGSYSSVTEFNADLAKVYSRQGKIVIENAGSCAVSVSGADGQMICSGQGDATVDVAAGVYVVTVGSKAIKVIVR